jgi:hypothetical protein
MGKDRRHQVFNAKKHIEHPKKIHEVDEKDSFVKYNKQYEYEPDDLDDDPDEPRTW